MHVYVLIAPLGNVTQQFLRLTAAMVLDMVTEIFLTQDFLLQQQCPSKGPPLWVPYPVGKISIFNNSPYNLTFSVYGLPRENL